MSEDYTLKPEDAGKILEVDGNDINDETNVIIPNNSNISIEIGTEVRVYRANEKQVKIEAESGVNLESSVKTLTEENGFPTFWIPKFSEAQIRKRSLNGWILDLGGIKLVPAYYAEGGDDIFTIEQNGALYRVHVFTTIGDNQFEITSDSINSIEYLVIAGGGSGGGAGPSNHCGGAGGGGAGGYRCSVIGEMSGGGQTAEQPIALTRGIYNVFVGAGGVASTSSPASRGTNGQNSVFGPIVSVGGGAGGAGDNGPGSGADGGSGGGRFRGDGVAGQGTVGQGFDGGLGEGSLSGGGGGGANQKGFDAPSGSQAGNGGGGIFSSIDGVFTARAGGGGGGGGGTHSGCNSENPGIGGIGGGGNGDVNGATSGIPAAGLVNSGSGGGGSRGGGSTSARGMGGDGGSGIVIVRYRLV